MRLWVASLVALTAIWHTQAHDTSTAITPCPTAPAAKPDFGSCPNPRIDYIWNPSGTERWAYVTANETQFPHGYTFDIATLESFICNRLLSPCHADSVALAVCEGAFDFFSGLTGEWAVAAWNTAMGLGWQGAIPSCVSDEYITTTTVTVSGNQATAPPTAAPSSVQESLTTETITTETTSTFTETQSTVRSPAETLGTTLTITITLPTSTISESQSESTTDTVQTVTNTKTKSYRTNIPGEPTVSAGSGSGIGGASPFDGLASPRLSSSLPMLLVVIAMLMSISVL